MAKKEYNSEDKKPEDVMEKEGKDEDMKPEDKYVSQEKFKILSGKIDKILDSLNKNMAKEEDEEKPEEEDKKKDHDEDMKPEDEKKKEDEEEKPEEEKKKEDGEPKPGEGEVKLPQAPAGETDEDAKPEGDASSEYQITEKKVNSMVQKGVKDVLKSMGITKSTTPRVGHEIAKTMKKGQTDFAMDMITKVNKGKMSIADMNRQTNSFVKKNHDEALNSLFDARDAKEAI